MIAFQIIRVAVLALARNKLRSLLTTLGIIIGVAAVIATVAMGEGARARVEQTFASMGTNLLIILPGTTTAGGVRGGFGSASTITWADLKAIQAEIPTVKHVAPVLRSVAQIVSEEQNWSTLVYGTTPGYLEIRNWGLQSGSPFTESDIEGGNKVALLGQTVVDKLFGPGADVVGQSIRIKNVPFEVIGVLDKKGQSPNGQDYDDSVYIPVTTFQAKIQGGLATYVNGVVFVGATSTEATAKAQTQISNLLRDRHHIPFGGDDDFSIRNLTETATAQEESARTLTMLLASVAAVSLLVGGIGIMNIMLVSVSERTREIGIRMAVGAKPRHILAQFLMEAIALSAVGGLLGVALGLSLSGRLAAQFNWPSLVRPDVALLAMGFSAAVGIVFGLYPARKASRLDPIEALRYE